MDYLLEFLNMRGAFSSRHPSGPYISVVERKNDSQLFNPEYAIDGQILKKMTELAIGAFSLPGSTYSLEDMLDHVEKVSGVVFLYSEGELIGFASAIYPRSGFFYLQGVAVAPHMSGKGYALELVRLLFKSSGLNEIALNTQNPRIFCLLRSLCHNVYPSPTLLVPERFNKRVSAIVAGKALSLETGVRENLYSHCLYEQIPQSGDEVVDRWFSDALSIVDGKTSSGFLLIGEGIRSV